MKAIHQAVVAAASCVGLVSVAEAHVFVGFGIGAPVMPVLTTVPVAPVRVYAPPPAPAYYAPPPAYVRPVVVGFYGHPRWDFVQQGPCAATVGPVERA